MGWLIKSVHCFPVQNSESAVTNSYGWLKWFWIKWNDLSTAFLIIRCEQAIYYHKKKSTEQQCIHCWEPCSNCTKDMKTNIDIVVFFLHWENRARTFSLYLRTKTIREQVNFTCHLLYVYILENSLTEVNSKRRKDSNILCSHMD